MDELRAFSVSEPGCNVHLTGDVYEKKYECLYFTTFYDIIFYDIIKYNVYMQRNIPMNNGADRLIEYIAEIQSIAQAGLFYGKDIYDKERYERLRAIATEMMALKTGLSLDIIDGLFASDYGYQTPKVDTRAAVIKNEKILLVHESDGTWSLPGGWCEYNLSPADNTIKEAKEESGKDIKIISVIAVQNRDNHNFPRYVYGVVKIFYLCEDIGGEFTANSETTEAAYFNEDGLPPLAEAKCTEEQVHMCFDAYRSKYWKTRFD